MTEPVFPTPDSPQNTAAAIRDLARQGVPPRQIAHRLGISPNHVNSSLSRDRAEGRMPVIRQLRPEAGEALELLSTDMDGLVIPSRALLRLGVEPGDPVVVVQLLTEIRIMSREAAADRIRVP